MPRGLQLPAPRRDPSSAPRRKPSSTLPQEVRVIGGQLKRSKLPVLDRPGLRPTPDRVRETLYNWIGPAIAGWRCLDAFAGSGALGFEAASRGAGDVVMIDRDGRTAQSLRETAARLRAVQVRVECTDTLAWMARCGAGSFDLVLLDPPFDAGLLQPALAAASRLVCAGGFVYAEASQPADAAAFETLNLAVHRSARAGAVHFQLLRRTDST